jgi:two-component system, chemotaxis family, protein-glutamate methylesterase/glutaminase
MIVMGGSLGGMQAVQTVLSALPRRFSVPLVIALHRPVDETDLLTPLLQRYCDLHVTEIVDKQPIEPGRVFIVPADYHGLVEPGYLSLSVDERVNYARPSIDVLFESAAFIYAQDAIGVVLTGAGSDGARGAAAIEKNGGTVVIEDPTTAQRADLPAAALAATARSLVLPLGRIAAELCELAERRRIVNANR